MSSSFYQLPAVVADQYIFTAVLEPKADTVVYAATQKDMQREVVVESLRSEAMLDTRKVRFFVESAKAKARMQTPALGACLELFYADETWHLSMERIHGEPLDMMAANGRVLSSLLVCRLMVRLCRACILGDMEGIASQAFSLSNAYLMELDFRFDNMAIAGSRTRDASRTYLSDAARLVRPLLDKESALADRLAELLDRMRFDHNWGTMSPVNYIEELLSLQFEIIRGTTPLEPDACFGG